MIVSITNDGQNLTVNYWKQERLICQKQAQDDVSMWSNLHGSQHNPIATYKPSASGVSIDLTDYVRTYPNVQYIYIEETNKSACTLTVSVKGLINPIGVIIPPHDLSADGVLILPPSKIIVSDVQLSLNEPTWAEFYATTSGWGVEEASMSINKRLIYNIGGGTYYFNIVDSNPNVVKTYTLERMQDCARYALVKWVSFTGTPRVHWFEIAAPKSATTDAYELQPIDNEYIEIKGRSDGLTLRLDGLDAYDLWYYADVLLSSQVEISLDGGQTFDRVQVTTKEVETPDFVANGKVELTVNWRRYDAVAM